MGFASTGVEFDTDSRIVVHVVTDRARSNLTGCGHSVRMRSSWTAPLQQRGHDRLDVV